MDLDKYSNVDGKIIHSEEISVETLQAIKIDAENNIAGLTSSRNDIIADFNARINTWQLKIDKINDLLK